MNQRRDEPATAQRNARRFALWLCGGIALVVAGTFAAFVIAGDWTPTPPPPLLFSKETTWFTGPLTPDGRIDWEAAVKAKAFPQGLADTDNAAIALEEALQGLLHPLEFRDLRRETAEAATAKGGAAVPPELDEEPLDAAIAAFGRSSSETPARELLREWLAASAPMLAKASAAMTRPSYFLAAGENALNAWPTETRLAALPELLLAFRLRIVDAARNGAVEAALADIASGFAVARAVGAPPTFFELTFALAREVELLEALATLLRDGAPLPPERVLAAVEARPARPIGEAALASGLCSDRWVLTSFLDAIRIAAAGEHPRDDSTLAKAIEALPFADLNALFHRVQTTFDELERLLLGGGRPARDRLDGFLTELSRIRDECKPLAPQRAGPLGLMVLSNDQLAGLFLEDALHQTASVLSATVPDWLRLTARRDALLAELAARAGAPERRDSWLGERLIVARAADGALKVSGPLLDLAREFAPGER